MVRDRMTARQRDLRFYLDILPDPSMVSISCHSTEMLCCLFIYYHSKKILLEDAGTIMVFFKHFDTTEQTLVGVGKVHVPRARNVSVLIPIINERMGWASETPLKLYEV